MDATTHDKHHGDERERWRSRLRVTSWTVVSVVFTALAAFVLLRDRRPIDAPSAPEPSLAGHERPGDLIERSRTAFQSGDFEAAHAALVEGLDRLEDPGERDGVLREAVKLAGRRARHEVTVMAPADYTVEPALGRALQTLDSGHADRGLSALYGASLGLMPEDAFGHGLLQRSIARIRAAVWRHRRGPATPRVSDVAMLEGGGR